MLRTRDLQFDFPMTPKENPPAPWLVNLMRAIADAVGWMGPVIKVVFWGGLALVVGYVLFLLGREVWRRRWPNQRPKAKVLADDGWRPTAAAARTLIEDADKLAAEGRFDEAVRLILFRSIEDIEARLPALVRPALTSRDIARDARLPASAGPAFARIAAAVEQGLFAGRPVDRAEFAACRDAYGRFALAETWT